MSTSWAVSKVGPFRHGRYPCLGTSHAAARVSCPYPFHPIRKPSDTRFALLSDTEPASGTSLFESKTAVGRIQFP